MPVLIYEGPKLNQNQRKEMIEALTDAACKVIPNVPREAYYVFLRDHPDEKIGVGGLTLTEYLEKIQKP